MITDRIGLHSVVHVLPFIKPILKSLVILVTWLALSGAIYSRVTLSLALNRIFFLANDNGIVKQNNQSDFKAFLNQPIIWQENKGQLSHCLANSAIKLCDFKMDLRKWQFNSGSGNFGLKLYLWIQIELTLRALSILKSTVWFQTKLHSTRFNYHHLNIYDLNHEDIEKFQARNTVGKVCIIRSRKSHRNLWSNG